MAAIDFSGSVQTEDVPVIPGWQTTHNCFYTFQGAHRVYQSGCPGQGINHDRIPSLMEVCLILEEHLFKSQLWKPLDKKHFQMGDMPDQKSEASIYADRRQLLMNIAMYTYDFNESLVMNDRTRIHSTTEAINDSVSEMDLSNIMPLSIIDLMLTFLNPDYHYSQRDRVEFLDKMTDAEKIALSTQTQRMLLANQRKTTIDVSLDTEEETKETEEIEIAESDVLSIRDESMMPGLFWDLQLYRGGLGSVLDDYIEHTTLEQDFHAIRYRSRMDFALIPTPLIQSFKKTGDRFVCLNVMVAGKGDEMWLGVHSLKMHLNEWPENPKSAVYYYGGRKSTIAAECRKRLKIESRPEVDGCWGNIQHESKSSLFSTVHLPYYQPGDWISFKIDTLFRCLDVFLNNELIICNVDCSDIPMPWSFVGVVDYKEDLLYIEQVTDICGGVCEGFVDGLHYL